MNRLNLSQESVNLAKQELQQADMLTKNLGAIQFQKLVKDMGLYELTTRGSIEINMLSIWDLEALVVLWYMLTTHYFQQTLNIIFEISCACTEWEYLFFNQSEVRI